MLGQWCADDAVAAAAFERVEIVEIADGAAEASRQRRDVGADPVRDLPTPWCSAGSPAGLTATWRLSGSTTASSRTRSSPPQPPAPWMSGMLGAIAIASRQRQPAGRGRRRRGLAACRPAVSAARAGSRPALPRTAGSFDVRGLPAALSALAGASAGRGFGTGTDATVGLAGSRHGLAPSRPHHRYHGTGPWRCSRGRRDKADRTAPPPR